MNEYAESIGLYHAVVDNTWQHTDSTKDARSWQKPIDANASYGSPGMPCFTDPRLKYWWSNPERDRSN